MLKVEECFYLLTAFSNLAPVLPLAALEWAMNEFFLVGMCSTFYVAQFSILNSMKQHLEREWNYFCFENFYPSAASPPQNCVLFITTSLSKSFCYLDHL